MEMRDGERLCIRVRLRKRFREFYGRRMRCCLRRRRRGFRRVDLLDVSELLFGQAGLFEDRAKCSSGNVGGVHGNIRLPSIGVAQDDVGAGLPPNYETSALQAGKDLTRFVWHRRLVAVC